MAEEGKDDSGSKRTGTTSFVLSLLCTLPFAAMLGLFAVAWVFGKPQLLNYLIVPCLFGWPVLVFIAIVGLISIVCALFQHPKLYPLLILCALVIVGFMAFWYYGITHLGPM